MLGQFEYNLSRITEISGACLKRFKQMLLHLNNKLPQLKKINLFYFCILPIFWNQYIKLKEYMCSVEAAVNRYCESRQKLMSAKSLLQDLREIKYSFLSYKSLLMWRKVKPHRQDFFKALLCTNMTPQKHRNVFFFHALLFFWWQNIFHWRSRMLIWFGSSFEWIATCREMI